MRSKLPLLGSFLTLIPFVTTAQEVDESYKRKTIYRLAELIENHYVFPEVGKKTSQHLTTQLEAGAFTAITSLNEFARALTNQVQQVNKDKHMRIRATTGHASLSPFTDDGTGGIKEVKMLEGNIGYIDLRNFVPPAYGKGPADKAMEGLSKADALIIDVRRNGGGSPEMVQYLCSYFFDQRIHLNSLYSRETNRTTEFWTIDVAGKKLPKIPLYILTSSYTFSAGEEFCYNMQTRKRATLIGETTGGGANPGGPFTIDSSLTIFIPTGRAINPITNTNWEGTGVVPDIQIEREEALDKALELARKAAEAYRSTQR